MEAPIQGWGNVWESYSPAIGQGTLLRGRENTTSDGTCRENRASKLLFPRGRNSFGSGRDVAGLTEWLSKVNPKILGVRHKGSENHPWIVPPPNPLVKWGIFLRENALILKNWPKSKEKVMHTLHTFLAIVIGLRIKDLWQELIVPVNRYFILELNLFRLRLFISVVQILLDHLYSSVKTHIEMAEGKRECRKVAKVPPFLFAGVIKIANSWVPLRNLKWCSFCFFHLSLDRRLNGFQGLSLNDRTILFRVILFGKTVTVG